MDRLQRYWRSVVHVGEERLLPALDDLGADQKIGQPDDPSPWHAGSRSASPSPAARLPETEMIFRPRPAVKGQRLSAAKLLTQRQLCWSRSSGWRGVPRRAR